MDNETTDRKTYEKPLVIHEYELEVRAGSPLAPDPDPLNLPGS